MSTATATEPTADHFELDIPPLAELQAETTDEAATEAVAEAATETIPLPSPGTDAGDVCDHDLVRDCVAPSSETAPAATDTSATDTSAPNASLADAPPSAPATDDSTTSPSVAGQPGEGIEEMEELAESTELADWQDSYRAIQERITTVLIELNAAKDRAKHLGKLLKELGEEAAAVKASRPEAKVFKDAWSDPPPGIKRTTFAAIQTATGASIAAATALADDLANQDPNAWRSIPINQLGLKPAIEAKLLENDISTIGQLEDLRAKGSGAGAGLRSIKGIGQAKADAIEDAVLQWLSANRDAEILTGIESPEPTTDAANDGNVSPDAERHAYIEAERAAYIKARAAELLASQKTADQRGQGEELLEPACEDQRYWNGGVEAFDRGVVPVWDCPIEPAGAEQDDWLRGWLTADLMEQAATAGGE